MSTKLKFFILPCEVPPKVSALYSFKFVHSVMQETGTKVISKAFDFHSK